MSRGSTWGIAVRTKGVANMAIARLKNQYLEGVGQTCSTADEKLKALAGMKNEKTRELEAKKRSLTELVKTNKAMGKELGKKSKRSLALGKQIDLLRNEHRRNIIDFNFHFDGEFWDGFDGGYWDGMFWISVVIGVLSGIAGAVPALVYILAGAPMGMLVFMAIPVFGFVAMASYLACLCLLPILFLAFDVARGIIQTTARTIKAIVLEISKLFNPSATVSEAQGEKAQVDKEMSKIRIPMENNEVEQGELQSAIRDLSKEVDAVEAAEADLNKAMELVGSSAKENDAPPKYNEVAPPYELEVEKQSPSA